MKDVINVKLTKQEEKQVKIGQIKADMGGVLSEFKTLQEKMKNGHLNMGFIEIKKEKAELQKMGSKIRKMVGTLKSLGVKIEIEQVMQGA